MPPITNDDPTTLATLNFRFEKFDSPTSKIHPIR